MQLCKNHLHNSSVVSRRVSDPSRAESSRGPRLFKLFPERRGRFSPSCTASASAPPIYRASFRAKRAFRAPDTFSGREIPLQLLAFLAPGFARFMGSRRFVSGSPASLPLSVFFLSASGLASSFGVRRLDAALVRPHAHGFLTPLQPVWRGLRFSFELPFDSSGGISSVSRSHFARTFVPQVL